MANKNYTFLIGAILLLVLGVFIGLGNSNVTATEQVKQLDLNNLKEGEVYTYEVSYNDKGDLKLDKVEKKQLITINNENNTFTYQFNGQTLFTFNNQTFYDNQTNIRYNLTSYKENYNVKWFVYGDKCNYIVVYPKYNNKNIIILKNNENNCYWHTRDIHVKFDVYSNDFKGVFDVLIDGTLYVNTLDIKNNKIDLGRYKTIPIIYSKDGYKIFIEYHQMGIDYYGSLGYTQHSYKKIIISNGKYRLTNITNWNIQEGYLTIKNLNVSYLNKFLFQTDTIEQIGTLTGRTFKDAKGQMELNESEFKKLMSNVELTKLQKHEDTNYFDLEGEVKLIDTLKGNFTIVDSEEIKRKNVLTLIIDLLNALSSEEAYEFDTAKIYNGEFRLATNRWNKVKYKPKEGYLKGTIEGKGAVYHNIEIEKVIFEGKNIIQPKFAYIYINTYQ